MAEKQKGGRLFLSDAGAELTDEIPKSPVGEAEVLSNRLQRLSFDDDGTNGFVAALLRQIGVEKELLETWVVHDRTSKMSFNCWLECPGKGYQ